MTQITLKNGIDNMQMNVLMGLFVMTHCATTDKKCLLDEISKKLNLDLKVEIVGHLERK